MSLIVAVKGPEGIVLAAESRRVLCVGGDPREPDATGAPREYITCDEDFKLLSFEGAPHRWVGIVLYGVLNNFLVSLLAIGREIEAGLPPHRLPVSEYARHVSDAFVRRATRPNRAPLPFSMQAVVAGYDEGEPEGRVFVVDVPASPAPVEQHAGAVGISYGGMREFIDRLLQGYDSLLSIEDEDYRKILITPLPLATMPLDECVALATFLIRTTMDMQRFVGRFGLQGLGGPIDVATITAQDGLRYIHRKTFDPQGPVTTHQATSGRPASVMMNTPDDIVRLAFYSQRASVPRREEQ